ncbi:MAG: TetR/AcrR family transcriptional regulator [Gammaproteobacteria bacterium]|jgi:TetR/AcrR family transcriptional regulator, transcriptional repressor for nem operon
MGQKADTLRQRIVAEADQLFYEQGYENTSFSDIADAVGISRGNFYYHFKTKDEILNAVIATRVSDIEAMLNQWTAEYPDPRQRILHYIDILTNNQENIKQHGCPIGTLCTELAKLHHEMREDANQMLTVMRDWLTTQLRELGLGKEAKQVAMHLLARSQGIATITTAFEDQAFLRQEVKRLKLWLDEVIAQHVN